jgi:hypothetical protein
MIALMLSGAKNSWTGHCLCDDAEEAVGRLLIAAQSG